jgi:aerobic carbon-monoxide dehydrogenase small subunit
VTTLPIAFTLNGVAVARVVEPRLSLVDFLRNDLGLTGTHVGCEHGVCGACKILMNGEIVRGCLVLAVQADGMSVETIEGLSERGALRRLQAAFHAHNALQCGFCTPGMLLAAADLLQHDPQPSRDAIRTHLSGNYCRCTGYHAIIDAIADAAQQLGNDAGAA